MIDWRSPARSSLRSTIEKVFLEFWLNSPENTCARASFLLKRDPGTGCFSVNFAKFLRTSFCYRRLRKMLLLCRKSSLFFFTHRYSIMLNCWKEVPTSRPTFIEIIVSLEEMLKGLGNSVSSLIICLQLSSMS